MATDRSSRERRVDWADFIVIVAAVTSFAFAIWGTPLAVGEVAGGETRDIKTIWLTYGLGGALGLAGVVIAQERRTQGRILVGAGGLVLLIGVFGFGQPEGAAWASIIPAVLMLVAAAFVGPLPTD